MLHCCHPAVLNHSSISYLFIPVTRSQFHLLNLRLRALIAVIRAASPSLALLPKTLQPMIVVLEVVIQVRVQEKTSTTDEDAVLC